MNSKDDKTSTDKARRTRRALSVCEINEMRANVKFHRRSLYKTAVSKRDVRNKNVRRATT